MDLFIVDYYAFLYYLEDNGIDLQRFRDLYLKGKNIIRAKCNGEMGEIREFLKELGQITDTSKMEEIILNMNSYFYVWLQPKDRDVFEPVEEWKERVFGYTTFSDLVATIKSTDIIEMRDEKVVINGLQLPVKEWIVGLKLNTQKIRFLERIVKANSKIYIETLKKRSLIVRSRSM